MKAIGVRSPHNAPIANFFGGTLSLQKVMRRAHLTRNAGSSAHRLPPLRKSLRTGMKAYLYKVMGMWLLWNIHFDILSEAELKKNVHFHIDMIIFAD